MKKNTVRQIGIDFGTSTTQVSFLGESDRPESCLLDNLSETMPSVIGFHKDGRIFFGTEAEAQTPSVDYVVIPSAENKPVKLALLEQEGENYEYDLPGGKKTARDVARLLVHEALKRAQEKNSFNGLVGTICCPTNANLAYRKTVRSFLSDFGLETTDVTQNVIEEPALAANMMRILSDFESGARVLIYDFGGGTFDTALVQVENEGGRKFVNVLCSDGRKIGGYDVDSKICDYVRFHINKGITLGTTPEYLLRLRCRSAKEALTNQEAVKIDLTDVTNSPASIRLTRDELNSIVEDFWKSSKECLDCLARRYTSITKPANTVDRPKLSDLGIEDIREIDFVVPAGGTSQIPMIQEQLKELFGINKIRNYKEIGPHLSVVGGAALCSKDALPNNLSHIGWSTYVVFYGSDKKPLQTQFWCEVDGKATLIPNPNLAREAYGPTATWHSTIVGDYPQISKTYVIPPSAKYARLLFMRGEGIPADKDIQWVALDGKEETCQADYYLLRYRPTSKKDDPKKKPIVKCLDNLPSLGTLEVGMHISGEVYLNVTPYKDGCSGQYLQGWNEKVPAENVFWSVGEQLKLLAVKQDLEYPRKGRIHSALTGMTDNEPG